MDIDLGQLIGAIILVAIVFSLSYKLTCVGGPSKRRFKSYLACLCVIYALAVALAEINGGTVNKAGARVDQWTGQRAPRDARALPWEEKNGYTRKVFLMSVVPAFFGVYCGRRSGRGRKISGVGTRSGPSRRGEGSPLIAASQKEQRDVFMWKDAALLLPDSSQGDPSGCDAEGDGDYSSRPDFSPVRYVPGEAVGMCPDAETAGAGASVTRAAVKYRRPS